MTAIQQFPLDAFLKRHNIPPTHSVCSFIQWIKEYVQGPIWLAGGAVMNLVKGIPHTSDYDFFFSREADLKFFEDNLVGLGAVQVFTSEYAVSYTYNAHKIQLIRRKWYPNVESIFADFDLTISMFAVGLHEQSLHLYAGPLSLWDLANRELHIQHINALGSTFKRIFKYGQRGFKLSADSYTTLARFFAAAPQAEAVINQQTSLPTHILGTDAIAQITIPAATEGNIRRITVEPGRTITFATGTANYDPPF